MEAEEQPRRLHPLDVPFHGDLSHAFLAKQLQTLAHARYSPSEHKTWTEGKPKHSYQVHKGCCARGVLTHVCAPEAWGRGIVVEMKAALFGLADGFTAHNSAGGACAKGISCWAREVQLPAVPLPGSCA